MSSFCKKRPKVFYGKRYVSKPRVPKVNGVDGTTSSAPRSASSKTEPFPPAGITSGVSTVLLRPRSIGEAPSSVSESGPELSGNRILVYRIASLVGWSGEVPQM